MPKRAVPLLLAVVALALPAFAAAQRPLTALLPDTTVLAVEVTPAAFEPGALRSLLAGLDTAEAAAVWDDVQALLVALLDEGAAGHEAEDLDAWRDQLAQGCPALATAVEDVEAGGWTAALGVSVSRFAPRPGALVVARAGSRAAGARLLAGAVACFDGRRFGAEGPSTIFLLGDESGTPLLVAERDGALVVATDPDLLRGALRRAGGSGEPSHADARISGYAAQLEPAGVRVTLDLNAVADAMGLFRGAVVPEAAELFDRLVTTLRVVNGYAWGVALDERGLTVATVGAWDARLAAAEGEDALLAMLACEGCALADPAPVPAGAVAVSGDAFPVHAAVKWVDSWFAELGATGAFGGETVTLRSLLAGELGFDLDAALLDWFGGSWHATVLGAYGTDLRDWLQGPPTLTVLPVTSEAAAWEGVRRWLAAAEDLDWLAQGLTREAGQARPPRFEEAVSVRELTHAGVDYLRLRAGPSLDVGVAVFDDQLVIGTPVASLLAAIDRRGGSGAGAGAERLGLDAGALPAGRLVGYSVTDVGAFLRGLADVAELAAGTVATTLWLGGYGLSEAELDLLPEGAALPTYDDLLVLTDVAVAALELLAERTGPAVGTTAFRDDARWSTWSLPLRTPGR